jgi:signal transduction histidine kinase
MERIYRVTRREKIIRNIYIVAFILLFVCYLITLFVNGELIKQSNRVEHTNSVIRSLDNLAANITTAETGMRGYLLSRDIRFLFPYYGTKEKSDSILAEIKDLTRDNPVQVERLQGMERLLTNRFEIMQYQVRTFENSGRTITDSMVIKQNIGKEIMDSIRSSISLLEREENRLLKAREYKVKTTSTAIRVITIITLALVFSLLFFGFLTYMQVSKQRKKAEQGILEYQNELTRRIKALDEANTELIKMRSLEKFAVTGRIARTIGHEVRNPLTNIILATDQLKMELANTGAPDYLFEMIDRNCNRINQLISDLLDSTKVSELNYERISLGQLLDETLLESKDRMALTNVTLIKDYDKADQYIVSVDKLKMKIALLNLITNALEAMGKKPGNELKVSATEENGKFRIFITDNGPGMDGEDISRIFEPYYTTKKSGNGLGLTNTQNIILNHKGDLSVESQKGKGTTFTITLDKPVVS